MGRLLGSGGMGQVFAAVREETGQEVALKLLSPESAEDPQLVARFLQEAQALAQLDHPGVVRVLDSGRTGTTAFLAMELLQGQSLREWMKDARGDFHGALALCRQLASIMVDVHARGIVHRDLKPENIFLCPDGAKATGLRVKLLDFGIAKLPFRDTGPLDPTHVHTHESTLIGTYAYMAPEQFRSAATVGPRADVYSLGVVLFELLAGRTPFASAEPIELLTAHAQEEPPALRQCAPDVPGALSAFVATLLAKAAEVRPTMARCQQVLARPWTPEPEVCPIPGLAPFTESQAALFYGRDAEVAALLGLLEEARVGARRWVQVEGPSGGGKSSLIHAGLLPRLRTLDAREGARWRIATVRPSANPWEGLAQALATAFASEQEDVSKDVLLRMLRAGPVALRDLVLEKTPPGFLLLLVLEPLEELLTLDAADRQAFDVLLAESLRGREVPLRLLTAVRGDFLHRVEHQLPALARSLPEAVRYPLPSMSELGLVQVVHGLSRHAGLQLEGPLASRMVDDARDEDGRLPLLGHALRGLWGLHAEGPLTLAHYDRMGGVGGALSRQAEGLLDALGREGRERAKWLLLDLVQVGRGVPDSRRPRSRQEVLDAAGGDGLAEEVLARLSGTFPGMEPGPRLIMLSGDPEPSRQRVDLAHETLLQQVPSLVGWLDHERTLLERQAELETAASAWEQAQHPEDGLPTGALRLHYQGGTDALAEGSPQARRLSRRAVRFLEAARRLEQRHARTQWMWRSFAVLASLLILMSAVRSEQQRQRAEASLRSFVLSTDGFVDQVDWSLSWLPFTLEPREKMLQRYQELISSLSDSEREQSAVRLTRIKLFHRLGDMAYIDARLSDSEDALAKALAELRAGQALHPEDNGLRMQKGLNDSKRAKVAWARGRWEEARGLLEESLELLKHSDTGTDPEDTRRSLAVSLTEIGDLELANQRLEAAVSRYGEAIELHAQNPGTYNSALLAETLAVRGAALRMEGDFVRSRVDLERALRLARDCVQADRGRQYFQWVLTRSLVALAMLDTEEGHSEPARDRYEEAITLGQQLRQGEMPSKRLALVLLQALSGYETWARTQGQSPLEQKLRQERCGLAREFQEKDPEDLRFQAAGCTGAMQGDE
ncbi:serine/threonine protein kinase [Corallococcus carmarthensis]|uniref:Serine/threonine protein kinase n=1 Tax=Corallococcus carmarthensis TaxID=2316728 RepID=A0A3A8K1S9_9BACT|nr:serine/threonine protein kinase [Corallococcus carmarthensis]